MALPSQYLTSTKNVKDILGAMQSAQAPKRFTTDFLEGLGFKSSPDRLMIGALKALGFLTPSGEPTPRYFEYLDQSQSAKVLGRAVQEAYADLFQVNTRANELSATDVKNKLRTLTHGRHSESVLDKMASTFKTLSSLADFASVPTAPSEEEVKVPPTPTPVAHEALPTKQLKIDGLVYNIQLQLPETRDPAVYDALFKSLRDHLF